MDVGDIYMSYINNPYTITIDIIRPIFIDENGVYNANFESGKGHLEKIMNGVHGFITVFVVVRLRLTKP